ncbi:hypothetical protein ED733_005891 [Metarhizium rileyi]|uniref:Uncharacterized protein n=1 Tax=Metarhizium rileyi (strain RCEF 4871) TaxID=1649241 RepID=A0A5C6GHG3_METRR|nr:hypothetical protein ED733_005891 [Metarhizium rileyi]
MKFSSAIVITALAVVGVPAAPTPGKTVEDYFIGAERRDKTVEEYFIGADKQYFIGADKRDKTVEDYFIGAD